MFSALLLGGAGAGASSYTIVAGGAPVTITTTVANENATLTFGGTAGQRISLKVSGVTIGTSTTGSIKVSITKPDGTALVAATSMGTTGGYIDTKSLPTTGTYTIVVDPQAAVVGSVTVRLYDVPPGKRTSPSPAIVESDASPSKWTPSCASVPETDPPSASRTTCALPASSRAASA